MKLLKYPYACAVCQESFTIPNALVSHVKTKHESVKPNEKEEYIMDCKPLGGKSQKENKTKFQDKNEGFDQEIIASFNSEVYKEPNASPETECESDKGFASHEIEIHKFLCKKCLNSI